MREIKFRCWYDKKMHKVVDIDFSYKRINLLGADIISFEQGILMQYTGLKDKNGKEIYEGDVVRFDYYSNGEINEFIIEIQDFWELTPFAKDDISDLEVIGNIHDNPELLKESD